MEGREIAAVDAAAIAASPSYQQLLADCREITERAERSVVEGFWRLGERIAKEFDPDDERSQHQINLALERDLRIDRTTLVRAVQTYRTWSFAEVCDTVSQHLLTWRKIRMLVALDEPLRKQIEAQILSGKLRTDADVHDAIYELKRNLGLLPAETVPRYELQLELDIDCSKPLVSIWRHAEPLKRAALVADLISRMELERMGRHEAVKALAAVRRAIDRQQRRLDQESK